MCSRMCCILMSYWWSMWQSCVEIESVEYFERIAAYKVLYCWERDLYVLCRCIRYSCVYEACVYEACVSPALSRSSVICSCECSKPSKIRDGIIFVFYTGLSHVINYKDNFPMTHIRISHGCLSVKQANDFLVLFVLCHVHHWATILSNWRGQKQSVVKIPQFSCGC